MSLFTADPAEKGDAAEIGRIERDPDNSSVGWFVGFSDQSSSHLRKNISQQHLPVVKSYTGQHSQFLRCFSNTHLRILINYTAQSAHSALKRIFL